MSLLDELLQASGEEVTANIGKQADDWSDYKRKEPESAEEIEDDVNIWIAATTKTGTVVVPEADRNNLGSSWTRKDLIGGAYDAAGVVFVIGGVLFMAGGVASSPVGWPAIYAGNAAVVFGGLLIDHGQAVINETNTGWLPTFP